MIYQGFIDFFARILSTRIIKVSQANSSTARLKIYKIRYEAYTQKNLLEDNYNHDLGILKDPEDDETHSTLYYTQGQSGVVASCRVKCIPYHKVSNKTKLNYDLTDLYIPDSTIICFIERLVASKRRNTFLHVISMFEFIQKKIILENNCIFCFATCAPGLLKHYTRIGLRPYANKHYQYKDRLEVLVSTMPDLKFLKTVNALTLAKNLNKKAEKELKEYYYNFRPYLMENIKTKKSQIPHIIDNFSKENKGSFFGSLDNSLKKYLLEAGCIIKLNGNEKIFTENTSHQEIFILLSGKSCIAKRKGIKLFFIKKGELIGELGIEKNNFIRFITVESTGPCEILILPRSITSTLIQKNPKKACQYLLKYRDALVQRERLIIKKMVSS